MQHKVSAFLFGMDGLLLDIERIVLDFFRQTYGSFGLSNIDHVYRCLGLRRADSRLVLERGLSHLLDLAQFVMAWETRVVSRLAHSVPVKPGRRCFCNN